jgi:hypothetical protein
MLLSPKETNAMTYDETIALVKACNSAGFTVADLSL